MQLRTANPLRQAHRMEVILGKYGNSTVAVLPPSVLEDPGPGRRSSNRCPMPRSGRRTLLGTSRDLSSREATTPHFRRPD